MAADGRERAPRGPRAHGLAARRGGPAAWAPLRVQETGMLLGALTVLFEVVTVGRGVTISVLGVAVSPALPPAVLLATLIGWRALGFRRERLRAWRDFLLAATALTAGLVLLFCVRLHWSSGVASVIVAATEEELLFRLALPVAVGAVVARALGRDPRALTGWGTVPRFAAVATAAVVFAVMPGHLSQVTGDATLGVIPFLALGVLLTYVVLRTGDLLPGMLLHVLLNMATFAYAYGGIDHPVWAALIVAGTAMFGWSAQRVCRGDAEARAPAARRAVAPIGVRDA